MTCQFYVVRSDTKWEGYRAQSPARGDGSVRWDWIVIFPSEESTSPGISCISSVGLNLLVKRNIFFGRSDILYCCRWVWICLSSAVSCTHCVYVFYCWYLRVHVLVFLKKWYIILLQVGLNLFVKRSLMHSSCLCVLLLIPTCACACVFEEVIYYTAACTRTSRFFHG